MSEILVDDKAKKKGMVLAIEKEGDSDQNRQ